MIQRTVSNRTAQLTTSLFAGLVLATAALLHLRPFSGWQASAKVAGLLLGALLLGAVVYLLAFWVLQRFWVEFDRSRLFRWALSCLLVGLWGLMALHIRFGSSLPLVRRLLYYSVDVLAIALIVFMAAALLTHWRVPTREIPRTSRFGWLAYALPMILVWGVHLLAFWPGLMTYDSIVQWRSMSSGYLTNAHPAFHTFVVWLLTRLVDSPAIVAAAQILFTALIAAWGLGLLRRAGVPWVVPWLLSGILALLPFTDLTVITLWKDVWYGASMLLLTLLVFRLLIDPGALDRPWTWISLGIAGLLVALFRHNGPPVAVGTLALLMVFFRRRWKPLATVLVVLVGLYVIINGPVYRFAKVIPAPLATMQVPMHFLGAHLAYGTPLQPEERALLDSIRPTSDNWEYDCYLVNSIYNDQRMNYDALLANRQALTRLLARLSLRNPMAVVRHIYCVSGLVWRIPAPGGVYLYIHDFKWKNGNLVTIVENEMGLASHTLLPAYRDSIAKRLIDSYDSILWRPAIYLYAALLAGIVGALRTRNSRMLLVLVPVVLQSLVLMLGVIANDYRYQYPAVLIAVFALGLLFLPRSHQIESA